MRSFFNPENFLWRSFGKLADYMFLSMCFFLASLPVVTIPAAAIALYDATSRCVLGSEGHPYGRFFRTFKNELLRGMGLAVLWGILAFVLSVGYQILYQQAQADLSRVIFVTIYYFSLFTPIALFCWLIPVESRFVYGFWQLHKVSLFIAFRHLPSTIAITALALAAFEICVNMPFMLILVPGICAYLQAALVERVFRNYMPKEETPDEV